MKANERFFICFIRVSIIIDYIFSYSIGRAVIEFLKVAATSFIISALLSLLTLFGSDKWSLILVSTRDEFIQIIGLKLSFYIIILLVGFGFILYRFSFLTRFISWFIVSISNIGFIINAVLTGVLTGVFFYEFFGIESNISSLSKLIFYMAVFGLSIIFYGATKIFSTGIRKEIDETLGKYTSVLTLLFGFILTGFGFYVLDTEEWSELAEKRTKVACIEVN